MNKELITSVVIAVLLIAGTYFFVSAGEDISVGNQQAQVSGGNDNETDPGYAAQGDVDSSGSITAKDAAIVFKSVSSGIRLNAERTFLADVDGDDVVTYFDGDAILSYAIYGNFNQGADIQRPLGDLDGSGQVKSLDALIVGKYLEGAASNRSSAAYSLTPSQMKAADVDLDGSITTFDREGIRFAAVNTLKLPVLYGDVDGNGKICATDSARVVKSLVASQGRVISTLPPVQRFRADINKDGVVSRPDADLILQAAATRGDTCTTTAGVSTGAQR